MKKLTALLLMLVLLLMTMNICRSVATDHSEGNSPPTATISQCYGKQISAECESNHVMRVVSATYLRSRDCVGGASDLPLLGGGNDSLISACSRDDVSGPQCVGNSSCIFTAPWIYISADCGYSNYFSLQYQCVPGRQLVEMCAVPALMGTRRGYIVSPGYPRRYPAAGGNCSMTIVVPSTAVVRLTVLDLFLTSYTASNRRKCLDKLWVSDAFNTTDFLCAAGNNEVIFTSSSNQATVFFTVTSHRPMPAKGFWLLYEAVDSMATERPPSNSLADQSSASLNDEPQSADKHDETFSLELDSHYHVSFTRVNSSDSGATAKELSRDSELGEETEELAGHLTAKGDSRRPAAAKLSGRRRIAYPGAPRSLASSGNGWIDVDERLPAYLMTLRRYPPLYSGRGGRLLPAVWPPPRRVFHGMTHGHSTDLHENTTPASSTVKHHKTFTNRSVTSPPPSTSLPTSATTTQTTTTTTTTTAAATTSKSLLTTTGDKEEEAEHQELAAAVHDMRQLATSAKDNKVFLLDVGAPEIGAMVGGAIGLLLLLLITPLAVLYHIRRRRLLAKPPFTTRNNSYRNVILAFGGDDDAAGTPPLTSTNSSSSGDMDLGCSNPVTSGPLADSECWWEASAWPPKVRKPAAAVGGGLMPIDERLEDLYAAAKQQQRWRESQKSGKTAASSGSSGGRRIARSKSSSRMRGGIDQLLGGRDWSRRDGAAARIVVPEHLLNVSVDSLSDSASSTTEEQGTRITTPYGRLKSGEKRHGKVSSVFVNPLRGRMMPAGGRRSNSSSSSSRQHQQLLQLQLAGPIVDAPYDAVLLENEDVAL